MASFSVPCPKTISLSGASQLNHKQYNHIRHRLISFRSGSKSNLALLSIQGSRQNQNDAFKVCAQLNEIAIEKLSNSSPVPQTESEESAKKPSYAIPDAASISAFMTQVADLVELVDSRDIVELQLKQQDCEVTIRKKEALPQPSVSAPVYMMQPQYPPAMVQSQLPQEQASGPVSGSPVPSPPTSPPPTPAKPKSTHPPLKCPMAGTFYRSPAPGAPAFVKVGDKVQKGQVICIIEAMKLMNEIEADQSGTVVEVLAEDGKPVSVDTPLFIIEP